MIKLEFKSRLTVFSNVALNCNRVLNSNNQIEKEWRTQNTSRSGRGVERKRTYIPCMQLISSCETLWLIGINDPNILNREEEKTWLVTLQTLKK